MGNGDRNQGTIRLAVRDDLPQIVAIYNASIPGRLATADTESVTVEQRREWFERHDPSTHPLFVLERDGRIVSWQSFERFYGRPAYRATAELSLYVAHDCQRQGLGRLMLVHAIERASDLQLENLLAFIFGHNEPSLRLFRSHGFGDWGHLPAVARLDGTPRDLIILGRTL